MKPICSPGHRSKLPPLLVVAATLALWTCSNNINAGPQAQVLATSAATPAKSGVKLLEDILGRMHSLPQIALNKQSSRGVSLPAQNFGATDRLLAIKPKETASPDLYGYSGGNYGGYGNYAGYGGSARSTAQPSSASASDRDAKSITPSLPGSNTLSLESQKRLTDAANKLYTISDQFAKVNQIAQLQTRQMAPSMQTPAAGAPQQAVNLDGVSKTYSQPQDLSRVSQTTIASAPATVTDWRKAERRAIGGASNGASSADAETNAPPAPPAVYSNRVRSYAVAGKKAAPQANYKVVGPGTYELKSSFSQDKDSRLPPIALTPPNVARGVPLMPLSTPENEAETTLRQRGKVESQKIGSWTVLSLKNNQGKTILQAYVRHGFVDAIRIFNQSVGAPDFGVRIGAPLSSVKERFGEPSFILSEPSQHSQQNYVYPLNQVDFQLAKTSPDGEPTVLSLLIFSVK